MHIHRLEKIWLIFGAVMLGVFLTIIGVSAFASGNQPPSDATLIDPTKVDQTKPFDKPGLKKSMTTDTKRSSSHKRSNSHQKIWSFPKGQRLIFW